MFKNYKEFQQSMLDYLHDIHNNYGILPDHYEEFQQDTLKVIEACVQQGYVANIEIWHDANGDVHAEAIGNIYVTLKGYEFINALEDNTSIKIARKAEKRATLSSIIAIIALFISAVTLVVEFLANYEEIKSVFMPLS